MNAVWCVIAVVGIQFVSTSLRFVDADEQWMRFVGRTLLVTGRLPRTLGAHAFAAPTAVFTPHEWLYGVGLAVATTPLAAILLKCAFAACAIGALALAALRGIRRGTDAIAVAFCAMFASIACFESYGTRPQVVGWCAFAGIVLLLDRRDRGRFWIIPLVVLWANVHASAVLAPAVVWLAAAGDALDEGAFAARTRETAVLALASSAALLCTPFGFAIVPFAFALADSSFRHFILEWHRPGFADLYFLAGSLPLLLVAMLRGLGARRRSFDALLFALTATMMFTAQRHAAFFALATLAPAAAGLSDRRAFTDALPAALRRAGSRIRRIVPVAALAVAFAGGFALDHSQPRPDPNRYFAQDVVGETLALHRPLRLACVHFGDCSYAIDSALVRVLIDGRTDPFPKSVWNDWETISGAEPGVAGVLQRDRIDAIVTRRGEPAEQAITLLGGWTRITADRYFALYLRDAHVAPTIDRDRDTSPLEAPADRVTAHRPT